MNIVTTRKKQSPMEHPMSTLLALIVLASLTNGSAVQTAKAVNPPKAEPALPCGSQAPGGADALQRQRGDRCALRAKGRFVRRLQNGARRHAGRPDECLGPRLPGFAEIDQPLAPISGASAQYRAIRAPTCLNEALLPWLRPSLHIRLMLYSGCDRYAAPLRSVP